jgi:hypothetical protein
MDFVVIEEEDLLEDDSIDVNNSAIVFHNNRVRLLLIYAIQQCVSVKIDVFGSNPSGSFN